MVKKLLLNRIYSFIKSSLIDWDGKISSVIFLSGCNWECPFCQNWRLCEGGSHIDITKQNPSNAIIKQNPSNAENDILLYLKKHSKWIDGVVLSGGEPLLEKDIIPFIKKVRGLNFKVKIDTNGSFPGFLKYLIDKKLVDYVAMDIKSRITSKDYLKATGQKGDVKEVKKSINILLDSEIDFEFRTTVVPSLVSEEDIIYNLNFIKSGTKYILQQFSNTNVKDNRFKSISPYTDDKLHKMVEKIKEKGVKSWLRN